MEVMTADFVLDILNVCAKHNYLPDNFVRNFKIKHEYAQMRAEGKSGKEARENLADVYCTSIKNIEKILYHREYKPFIMLDKETNAADR